MEHFTSKCSSLIWIQFSKSFLVAEGGKKGGKRRTNTHTHAKTTRENYTLIRLGSSDLRGWVPSLFSCFLFLQPESKLASSSRSSSRFHAGTLLTCSCCWLVYASPLERPFVFCSCITFSSTSTSKTFPFGNIEKDLWRPRYLRTKHRPQDQISTWVRRHRKPTTRPQGSLSSRGEKSWF